MKKGEGLPLKVIVVAVLLLLVLIVLGLYFGLSMKTFGKETSKSCSQMNGQAPDSEGNCLSEKPIKRWVRSPEGTNSNMQDPVTKLYPCCVELGVG